MRAPRTSLRPGDVVVLDVAGAVERKARPVVVLSSEEYHRERPDLIAGFITTQVQSATSSSDCVLLDWQQAGLRRESAFRSFLATEPQAAVTRMVGRLSERDWSAVKACLRRALEVD